MRRLPASERLYELIGKNIGRLRNDAHPRLSQTALAKRCGLTRGSIANIELGNQRPTLHTLLLVAEALDVELRALLPTRVELAGPSVDATDTVRISKRLERAAGESHDKVASFIATSRHEVQSDEPRNREKSAAVTKEGRH